MLSAAERRGLDGYSTIRREAIARAAIRAGFARVHFRSSRTSVSRRSARPAILPSRPMRILVTMTSACAVRCAPILRIAPNTAGLFRTPTLRNVARKRVFLHNGVFHSLEDVVRFYAERDTAPQKWYPRGADGQPLKFDDLPPAYHGNVDEQPPFGRAAGAPAALSDVEVHDIVAFLETLTDGYGAAAHATERGL